jgi:Fe-S cluster biosynthesis and repair protein YggX
MQIEGYLGEKERIFDALFEIAARLEDKDAEEVTELQREEVDKLKEEFSTMTKETWNKVMEHEIILINQLEQVRENLRVIFSSGPSLPT